MNIREAILKAADHIENHPDEFNFITTDIPFEPACGYPGCALGWIGCFMGLNPDHRWMSYSKALIPLALDELGGDDVFYNRLTELTGSEDWMAGNGECARALRLYADIFHPEVTA